MRAGMVVLLVMGGLGAAGCRAPEWDGVARSCADPQEEGAPCEGHFLCNANCSYVPDGYLTGCIYGTIFRGPNDCGLGRLDAGLPDAPVADDCSDPASPGATCTGSFECHTACPWDGVAPYACRFDRIEAASACVDAGS